ncbi:MAG: hypothetical protein L0215_23295, partial [Gemmataceae bacterium]|nr:hypothetical protein [Gemmataceae bacterium]
MARRTWLSLILLCAPAIAQAQNVPERLLPAGSQIFLRWDGVEPHRAAYNKSALGQFLSGDAGKFLAEVWKYGMGLLESQLPNLGVDANASLLLKEVPDTIFGVSKHGFLIGLEVESLNPPKARAVLVFPHYGGDKGVIALVKKASAMGNLPIQETKVGNRVVHHMSKAPVHVGFWTEPDDDAVFYIGTDAAPAYAESIGKGGFATSATYKKLAGFKEFETWGRAYVDIPSLLKTIGGLAPQAEQIIGDLGLKGLGGVTFQSGFDGPAERSILEIETPGPRKGLLALLNRKTFTLADLPPLPNDLTSISASNFNPKNLFEGIITIAETAVGVFAPGFDLREGIKQVEGILGVKLGDDLFGSFGDMSVSYSSGSEGLLSGVYLFKVNDEKKLAGAIDSLFAAIPQLPGLEVNLKKRDFHGGKLMELVLRTDQGDYSVGAMTIQKGWFMLGGLPQSVYGFLLRSKGELPTWKASPEVQTALAAFPKEFTAISISDPRPAVQFFLSLAPTALSLSNSFLPLALPGAPTFDLSVIPHAQYATRGLFPNVTVTTDDGKKIRSET